MSWHRYKGTKGKCMRYSDIGFLAIRNIVKILPKSVTFNGKITELVFYRVRTQQEN